MKKLLTILLMGASLCAFAQTEMLKAGVYNWDNASIEKNGALVKRQVIKGKTLDLNTFEIYTLTLKPKSGYLPPANDSKFEQLIVVKSGSVKLVLKDSSQTVGPGSIALVLAGDKISYQNLSDKPATWYVINFRSVIPANVQRANAAGPSFIRDWDKLAVTRSEKGEGRNIFDRPTSMFEQFNVHATALNPGYSSHPPHQHRQEELILMLQGEVQETIGEDKFMAHAGDCIYLSSTILHGPKNISDKPCYYLAIQWHNLKTDQ